MDYYITVEPSFAGIHWCNQCIEGIKYSVSSYGGSFTEVSMDDGDCLNSIAEEERPVMIVVGSLLNWITETVHRLNSYRIHSIILASSPPMSLRNASYITMDYTKVLFNLGQYLLTSTRRKIALLGVHPNSLNDLTKIQAFRDFTREKLNNSVDEDIYWNYGLLESCCNKFYKNWEQYGSVICSNDIVAIKLLNYLKERNIKVPQQMYLACLGENVLAQMVEPSITTVSLDFYEIGKYAVKICNMLKKYPSITSFQAKMNGIVSVRESTGSIRYNVSDLYNGDLELPQESDFYADADVNEILLLVKLFSHCDQLDFYILKGILSDQKYPKLAEELYTTESTIKYRMKRMKNLANNLDRKQILKLIRKYINQKNMP